MPKRAFHNLDGLIRDLVAAQAAEGDDGWNRLVTFCRIIADVLDILEDDDTSLPDPDEDPSTGAPAQLDLPNTSDRDPLERTDAGHGPVRDPHLGGTSTVVAPMERVRHLARAALAAELAGRVRGRADTLVRTVGGFRTVRD